MHRHHLGFGQDVIQVGEDGFLHLTCIFRAADQDDLAAEIAGDDGFRTAAVALGISLERGQIDDRHLGIKAHHFIAGRADQQIADEQRMPGEFREDAGPHAVGGISPAIEVLGEQFLALGMGKEIRQQHIELTRRQGTIVVPPDSVAGQRVLDHEFVLGRTTGEHTGIDPQGPTTDQHRFVALEGLLVKRRRFQIPAHALQLREARCRCIAIRVEETDVFHGNLPRGARFSR